MNIIRTLISTGITVCFIGLAVAQDFPKYPVNKSEAEAQGLARAGIDELKSLMPGTIKQQGHKGNVKTKTFRPDGTLEINNFHEKGSAWRFNETNNGYCNDIPKAKKVSKKCFVTFKAKDGLHYFDYDVENGFFSAVWRPESK